MNAPQTPVGSSLQAPGTAASRPTSQVLRNPRFVVGKLARFGNTVAMALAGIPNQEQSVAPYWSMDVVGIHRPRTSASSGPAELEGGELSVDLAALHRAAEHQMVAAPGVVAAIVGGGLKGAAEIGFGEGRDVLRHAQFLSRVVESGQRGAQLRVQIVVRFEFARMRVEAAERAEEYLPAHPEIRLHLDDLRHLLQLRADAKSWGTSVFSVVDFASAEASAAASLMLCDSVSLAACTRDTPLSVVSRLLSAFEARLRRRASC